MIHMGQIVEAFCARHQVDPENIVHSESRAKRWVALRALAMAECRRRGFTMKEIGRFFGRDYSTVSYMLKTYAPNNCDGTECNP